MNAAIASYWRRLRLLVFAIFLIAAVPATLSLTHATDHRKKEYPARSLDGGRKLNLQYERDYQYEATFEKCEIQSIDVLAATLRVPATPAAVARAYAARHQASIRGAVYKGCRDAYLEHWAPPSQSG